MVTYVTVYMQMLCFKFSFNSKYSAGSLKRQHLDSFVQKLILFVVIFKIILSVGWSFRI